MTTAINARDGDGIRVWKCDVGHTGTSSLPCYKGGLI